MSTASFASLHSGLLARKGEARPVPEPTTFAGGAPAPIFQTQTVRSMESPGVVPIQTNADEHHPAPQTNGAMSDINTRPRVRDASASWPQQKRGSVAPPPPSAIAVEDEWAATRPALAPQGVNRHAVRSSVRMTHAQARALRLASIVLDRPQQELLEAGLENQLQALACSDLANCACFQAVLAMLETR